MPEQEYKRCSKCGEAKPPDDFYRDKRKPDGRESWCKRCKLAANVAWQAANRKRAAGYAKRWRDRNPTTHSRAVKRWRDKNPERIAEHDKRQKERHPEKHRAHWMVWNAVKQGKLVKPGSCEACGQPCEKRNLHGHHEDYSKPLEVEWLCHPCHIARHRP